MSLRSLAERAFRGSGALHAIRFRQRRRLRILMYHRFPGSPEEVRARLAWQCGHLRRYFHPVAMTDVAHAWKSGETLPANSLAITVDDGYRDFALAAPVFLSFGFRPAIFVVSGFLDREIWLWPDRVRYLFANTRVSKIEIDRDLRFEWRTPEERASAERNLDEALIRMPDERRLRILAELPDLMQASLPSEIPEEFAPLSWSQLRALRRDGVEVGAHTRTHPLLARIEDVGRVREEIEGSKRCIEAAIEAPVAHFCYPNGTRADYDRRSIDAARRAGYETAVTTEPGLNDPGADPFQLSRIGVDPALPPAYFERCVAGWRANG